jgi:hypothetical protein
MNKAKQSPMLVNTANADGIITPIKYARTKDGKINLAAYKNKKGQIKENNLTINVKILESRVRYGHLDLKVTPLNGEGEVWVERKNILIESDPAMTKDEREIAATNFVNTKDGDNERFNMNAIPMDEIRKMVEAIVKDDAARGVMNPKA